MKKLLIAGIILLFASMAFAGGEIYQPGPSPVKGNATDGYTLDGSLAIGITPSTAGTGVSVFQVKIKDAAGTEYPGITEDVEITDGTAGTPDAGSTRYATANGAKVVISTTIGTVIWRNVVTGTSVWVNPTDGKVYFSDASGVDHVLY